MPSVDSAVDTVYGHRRGLFVVVLALVLTVGAGVVFLEVETTFDEVYIGTEEEAALDRIDATFEAGEADVTYAQLVVEGAPVFERETLLATLELQAEIRSHEAIQPTLVEGSPTFGVANLVALEALGADDHTAVSLAEKREAIASMSQSELDALVAGLETADGAVAGELWRLLPNDADDLATVESTMIVAVHAVDADISSGAASDEIIDAQEAMQALATAQPASVQVAGNGLLTAEMNQSTEDTLSLLGPIALGLVLLVLVLAYRRLIDIVLSLLGIVLVLAWTMGALGWLGIAFNPILIAIPVFLIGLSIDFGLHVFMRYREHHDRGRASRNEAMVTALAGVGVALLWITVTTVTGFLSNLVSPMQPIRELGVMAAIGILGSFVVFAGLLPPVKVELDDRLDGRRLAAPAGAIGTGDGPVGRALATVGSAAAKAPVAILVIALVVSGLATATAVGVDTSFDHEDNVATSAPDWAADLPEPLAPGSYTVRDTFEHIDERYLREGNQVQILIEGDVTDPAVLSRIDEARSLAREQASTVQLANGALASTGPLDLMAELAGEDPAFRERLLAADTTGDGLPDRDIEALFDEMRAIAPDRTAEVLHRGDDGYEAIRLTIAVDGAVDRATVTEELRAVAGHIEGDAVDATATGEPITHHLIDQELVRTILASLFITVGVVGLLLMGVFRVVHGSASLGLVTLLPVTMGVAWIIATVDLLGYSLDVVTALTASLTIGIGIDYSIHISERFRAELATATTTREALRRTIRGTGGALFASATTTAIGFGVLAFAINPMLQQFGTITAIMIGYAFLGAVVVLPGLLVIWAKVLCPSGASLACETAVPRGTPAD